MSIPNPMTDEIALKIIEEMYDGKLLTLVLQQYGISRSTFKRYVDAKPLLSEELTRARGEGIHHLAESTVIISDTETDPQRARNRIDSRKWLASKLQPQVYGDRVDVNVNQTVDLIGAITAARARVQSALPASYRELDPNTQLLDNKSETVNEATGHKPVDSDAEEKS